MISTYISKISFNEICSNQYICSLIRPFRTLHLFLVFFFFLIPSRYLPHIASFRSFFPLFLRMWFFFSLYFRNSTCTTSSWLLCQKMHVSFHIWMCAHERKRERKSEPFSSCSRFFFFFGSGIGTFEYFHRFVVYSQRISLFSTLNTQSPFMRVKFIRKQSTAEPRSILSACKKKKNWDVSFFLFGCLNTLGGTQKLNIQANNNKIELLKNWKRKPVAAIDFSFLFRQNECEYEALFKQFKPMTDERVKALTQT